MVRLRRGFPAAGGAAGNRELCGFDSACGERRGTIIPNAGAGFIPGFGRSIAAAAGALVPRNQGGTQYVLRRAAGVIPMVGGRGGVIRVSGAGEVDRWTLWRLFFG